MVAAVVLAFRGNSYFLGATFQGTFFENAAFQGDADFSEATFQAATFSLATCYFCSGKSSKSSKKSLMVSDRNNKINCKSELVVSAVLVMR